MVRRLRLIGSLALCLALVLVAGAPAGASSTLTEGDRAVIRAVIEDQIDAFRRDDGAAAFACASEAIQEKFGDSMTFMAMVRAEYPMIYRPSLVRFHDLDQGELGWMQRVEIEGEDGTRAMTFYIMAEEGEGNWRIDGVAFGTTSSGSDI